MAAWFVVPLDNDDADVDGGADCGNVDLSNSCNVGGSLISATHFGW